jgi:UDP-N-acetylglucosamine 1-carboxyvinyltransferase
MGPNTIIPDRIEAGTFLIAGAITKGNLLVEGCVPDHLPAVIAKLRQAGVEVCAQGESALRVKPASSLDSVDVTTEEHPGFATDLQAQFMALMTQANGISLITETIFENRFMHVLELARMGANVRVEGRQAIVAGPRHQRCSGDRVGSWASAPVLAAGRRGKRAQDRVYHIDAL